MQAEFPEVRENCGVPGVELVRDRRDRHLLHLVSRHRSNMRMRAEQDGRLACFHGWARERGYRLQPAGADGPREWPRDPAAQRRLLDAIADRCDVPRATFVVRSADSIELRPHPATPYRKMECVIGEMTRHDVPPTGFVGTESVEY